MKFTSPLQFEPRLKRAIWGGERLERELGKPGDGARDVSESWEVCDLPGNISIVRGGEFDGESLHQLIEEHRSELLGEHRKEMGFPLLIKFLDAKHHTSLQVHPNDPTILPDGTQQLGKAEAWIVMDAKPTSRMYTGLRPGVSKQQLREALISGDLEECLHGYRPVPGDCIYLKPGTVHAFGGGLLIAEVQQPSDITYRLHDWNRTQDCGQSRELHIEQGLTATDFQIGPVNPVTPRPLTVRKRSELLVECPHFVIHRHFGPDHWSMPDDQKMHVLMVLEGVVRLEDFSLERGKTAVMPAARKESVWEFSDDAVLIDAFLPS